MGVVEEKNRKDNQEVEKGRLKEGQDVLGCDGILSWSRALTHPNASQGLMVAILDFIHLFGFGFRDVIGPKPTPVLLL